jgi:hypothetical protein
MIDRLGQRGVDVSQPAAALAAGNTGAAGEWLRSWRQAHPAPAGNSTRQLNGQKAQGGRFNATVPGIAGGISVPRANATETRKHLFGNASRQEQNLQAFIDRLGQEGADTSGLEEAIGKNDPSAVRAWLASRVTAPARPASGETGIARAGNTERSLIRKNATATGEWKTPGLIRNSSAMAPGTPGRHGPLRMNNTSSRS